MRQNLFYKNKYRKWYFKIIDNANLRKIQNGYTEKHHIIPKCLNGSNDKDNIANLTAREHFICHLLLTKMVKTKEHRSKMFCAFVRFFGKNEIKRNSKTYSLYKEKLSKEFSGEGNPFYGKTHSIKTREILSKSSSRFVGKLNPFFGKHHTEDYKKKKSKMITGRKLKCRNFPYKLIDPNGKVYIVKEGIKSFCKEHNLQMSNVIAGAQKNHKSRGWKISYVKTNKNKIN